MGQRFKGPVLSGATKYVPIPIAPGGRVFIDIQWKDVTSNATITLETTGSGVDDAPIDAAGAAWVWKAESGVTITGPAASAAGSTKLHLTGIHARRARLKIVAAANCDFEIYSDSEGS